MDEFCEVFERKQDINRIPHKLFNGTLSIYECSKLYTNYDLLSIDKYDVLHDLIEKSESLKQVCKFPINEMLDLQHDTRKLLDDIAHENKDYVLDFKCYFKNKYAHHIYMVNFFKIDNNDVIYPLYLSGQEYYDIIKISDNHITFIVRIL